MTAFRERQFCANSGRSRMLSEPVKSTLTARSRSLRQRKECPRKRPKALRESCARSDRSRNKLGTRPFNSTQLGPPDRETSDPGTATFSATRRGHRRAHRGHSGSSAVLREAAIQKLRTADRGCGEPTVRISAAFVQSGHRPVIRESATGAPARYRSGSVDGRKMAKQLANIFCIRIFCRRHLVLRQQHHLVDRLAPLHPGCDVTPLGVDQVL